MTEDELEATLVILQDENVPLEKRNKIIVEATQRQQSGELTEPQYFYLVDAYLSQPDTDYMLVRRNVGGYHTDLTLAVQASRKDIPPELSRHIYNRLWLAGYRKESNPELLRLAVAAFTNETWIKEIYDQLEGFYMFPGKIVSDVQKIYGLDISENSKLVTKHKPPRKLRLEHFVPKSKEIKQEFKLPNKK